MEYIYIRSAAILAVFGHHHCVAVPVFMGIQKWRAISQFPAMIAEMGKTVLPCGGQAKEYAPPCMWCGENKRNLAKLRFLIYSKFEIRNFERRN